MAKGKLFQLARSLQHKYHPTAAFDVHPALQTLPVYAIINIGG